MDNIICSRANWLVDVCESSDVYILNGLCQATPAPYTCFTNAGNSVVDYIMCTSPEIAVQYDREAL